MVPCSLSVLPYHAVNRDVIAFVAVPGTRPAAPALLRWEKSKIIFFGVLLLIFVNIFAYVRNSF